MSTPVNQPRHQTATDGFIVVAVLWIIAALATLTSIYALYINNTTHAFAENDDRTRTEAAISASLSLTAYELSTKGNEHPSTRSHFNFRLGRANVAVAYFPETARIDLNAAPKALLAGLFSALGASDERASIYADRIIEWRTPPGNRSNADGASLYRTAGFEYDPRQASFASISELWLVRGLPQELVARAMPYLTVFSGGAGIDPLDAPPMVLSALPGMTPSLLNTILHQRSAEPQNERALLAMLGPLQTETVATKSDATRIAMHIQFDNGRKVEAEAVITVSNKSRNPYRVLFWRDNLDGDLSETPYSETPR